MSGSRNNSYIYSSDQTCLVINYTKFVQTILCVFLIIVGSGCNQQSAVKHDQRTKFTSFTESQAKQNRTQTAPHLPNLPPIAHFKNALPLSSAQHQANANTNPLEAYAVNQLRLGGIIRKDNQLIAYLLTPDNALIAAHVGNKIGTNAKIITAITDDHIVINNQSSGSARKIVNEPEILSLEDGLQ